MQASSVYKKAIIVTPVYKEKLNSYELISFLQAIKILGNYPIVLIAPPSLDVSYYYTIYPKIKVEIFGQHFFGTAKRHSILLLSHEFYSRFRQYKYMLMYHLDAFVFSDQLDAWANKGYDYIGSPWFPNFADTHEAGDLFAVGNGGFSLRNIQSFLKVTSAYKIIKPPAEVLGNVRKVNIRNRVKKTIHIIAMLFGYKNNTRYFIKNYRRNEDEFWGVYAQEFFPWFKVPDVGTALQFSFECDPAHCYQQNNRKLPFGCHAWDKTDLEFWRPFILENKLPTDQ